MARRLRRKLVGDRWPQAVLLAGLVFVAGARRAGAATPPGSGAAAASATKGIPAVAAPGATAAPAASVNAAAAADERPIADPPREPTRAGVRRAKELYNEGTALAQKGDLAAAFRAFRGSYEQDGGVEALANMAILEKELGRPRAAAEHLDAALERLPFSQAEKAGEVKRRLAEICKEITVLTLHVTPEGSQVYVDDRGLGAGPMDRTVYLDPGAHVVLVRVSGTVVRREVRATKGATEVMTISEADSRPRMELSAPQAAVSGPTGAAAVPLKWWILAEASLVLTVTGAVGLGMYARGHDGRTTLERQISQLGGRCGALPATGFVDACHARDQETTNELIGAVIGTVGAAGLTSLWLGALWAQLADRPASPKTSAIQVLPALGGLAIKGSF